MFKKCIETYYVEHKNNLKKLPSVAIFKMDNQQSTWNPAQCFVAVWMEGEFGGEWIHAYVWLSPFTVHLKLSQHC